MSWDGVYALVEAARTGDPDAWTDLHALVQDYLLGVAQKLLGRGWPHESAHRTAGRDRQVRRRSLPGHGIRARPDPGMRLGRLPPEFRLAAERSGRLRTPCSTRIRAASSTEM